MTAGCGRPAGPLFPAVDAPRVWPPPPEPPRIRWIGVIRNSSDLRPAVPGAEAMRAALQGPRPPMVFASPQGVAVSDGGLLAVTDGNAAAVHLVDLNERDHRVVYGGGEERFGVPMGAAWAGARLFVADAARGEVVELELSGAWVAHFGGEALRRPVGIAYVPERDELYVADAAAHQLVVFRPDGAQVGAIGGRGTGPGEFNFPTFVAYSPARLLVSDSGNSRLQVLDLDGRWRATIGRRGDAAGDLSLPKGVAYDREGHIYVVDAHFENVQIFSGEGQLLLAFGGPGSGWGEFATPAGIAVDSQDRIWVSDAGHRRLQVFQFLRTSS